uniref:ABC-type xenobiotic transporter n=1 Tax=Fagus sylvatica TaxID=28930 RepID=A0A2N9EGD7_FAGSY
MELVQFSKHGLSVLFSHNYSSLMYSGTDFLMKPVFLRGFSGSLHLVLLFVLFISWVCKKFKGDHSEGPKEKLKNRKGLVTLLDLALKTLSWGALCVYMHTQLFNSGEEARKLVNLPVNYFVSDVISVVSGLFFCYVGFFGKNEGNDSLLEEPLLNGDSTACNEAESSKSKGGENVTPYSNAGFFSNLTLSWLGPLIALGKKKTLDLEDVPQLAPGDSVVGAFPTFRNKLEAECGTVNKLTTLKLAKALIIFAWKDILLTALYVMICTLASYVGPYLIDNIVQYLNGRRQYKGEGYVLVSVLFAAKLVECISQRHWFFRLHLVGIRVRSVLVAMIYNKGLTLSCQLKQGHSSGEIINLMAVDAERIGDFGWFMHDPWMVLLEVAIALLILYKNLGLASIVALVTTVLVMLAYYPLGKLEEKFQDKIMDSKDKRMKETSEILRNMRILKLQGWEMKFLSKIIKLRETEAGWLKRYVYSMAMTTFVFCGAPTFVSAITFGACILMGIPLESGKILSALATFRILQQPIFNLPDTIAMIAQTKVSLDRIVSFLRLDDLQFDAIEKLPRSSSETAIEIIDGNFSWDLCSSNPTLKDINLKVQHGMRVAVCGTVGSGKSSLLSCILGEIPRISGTVKLCGTKAYVAQSPWIQSGKIEENILFGKEMVLEACSLKKDLEILSFGDQTVIGERGINLSGGQKQRIQIARALYQDSDIYLFDDPFSAVDAHTGFHLFRECLLGLLSSKVVIYVTHQVEFLPAADLILVMKDGRITQAGKYNEILNSGTAFMELVGAHKKSLSALDSAEAGSVSESSNMSKEARDMAITDGVVQKQENKDFQNGQTDNVAGSKGQIIQEEEREKGKVGFSVYWEYISMAYRGVLVPFILLAEVLYQVFQIGSNYWMALATPISQDVKPAVSSSTLIITANLLFNKMHHCIFRAPMSFFIATPSGRILNRTSMDQSTVELDIPYQVGEFAFSMIRLLGFIAVMSQVAWQASTDQSAVDFNIPYQVGAFAFSMIQLLGIIAVMSQVAWQVFIIFIPVIATGIWYQGMVVLSLGYVVFYHICLLLDFLDLYSRGSSLIRMENKIISVERILQYTCISSEPPLVIEENRPDHSWPPYGEVDLRDLQLRYASHMPLVLRGLTCTFPGGKKTGIVGRTGSGKSTLIQALSPIVEPTAGQIMIDGINISFIGLHDLQSRLSIIPQDPTMFEGTIRSNLDPLDEYSDEQIWEALDKCQLGDKVREKEGKLDSTVSENGENWSVGQRQLVCLGRVLLKKSKVLVLDEATASVDTATDNLIQQTLGHHFSNCLVITIAHRITSVLDSDMVVLLDNGLIEECDSPTQLLENKSSSFAQLVAEYTVRSNSSFG